MTEIARRNCKTDAERRTVKPMSEARLVSMGLLERKQKRLVPTYGYCVVSGMDAPDILRPLIKCGAFCGTKKGDFVDRRTCEGRLVDQIDEAYQFVLRNIRVGSEIVGTGRRDVYELPIDSIREAICNAVFHRDYLEPSCVYVAIYDDRLEIVSPGGLVREMTLEDARNGFSKLRNFGIGAALEYMKEVEGWGGGVSRYFESCEKLGLPLPIVEETAGCVKVVFLRRRITANGGNGGNLGGNGGNSGGDGVNAQTHVLSLLRENPRLTAHAVSEKTGMALRTVERTLADLKKSGTLVRQGGTRGYWEIVGDEVGQC